MWQHDYSALYIGVVRTFQLGILWALEGNGLIDDPLFPGMKAGISRVSIKPADSPVISPNSKHTLSTTLPISPSQLLTL
jgi:hypothetical protein